MKFLRDNNFDFNKLFSKGIVSKLLMMILDISKTVKKRGGEKALFVEGRRTVLEWWGKLKGRIYQVLHELGKDQQ